MHKQFKGGNMGLYKFIYLAKEIHAKRLDHIGLPTKDYMVMCRNGWPKALDALKEATELLEFYGNPENKTLFRGRDAASWREKWDRVLGVPTDG